jgi:hypothetical protein
MECGGSEPCVHDLEFRESCPFGGRFGAWPHLPSISLLLASTGRCFGVRRRPGGRDGNPETSTSYRTELSASSAVATGARLAFSAACRSGCSRRATGLTAAPEKNCFDNTSLTPCKYARRHECEPECRWMAHSRSGISWEPPIAGPTFGGHQRIRRREKVQAHLSPGAIATEHL